MTEQLYCAGTGRTGDPCRRQRTPGSHYCYYHDPARADERATGLRELPEPLLQAPVSLETPAEVRALLTTVANHLATAPRPDAARAHSLATVAGVLLRAVRLSDLHHEITHLRARVEELTRLHAESERQLTYARQDAERSRRSLADLRDHLHPGAT